MDDDDSLLLGVLNLTELTHFTVVDDVALICTVGINAAQHIHQRGFARAVLTDQRVDFAFLHL